ncbi:hypothetical protein PCIT_a4539 [Pseudoalteromonas citrea]|uniref:DUF2931 family protein n=2 Tax=Pseudoalteromonas citrea TaxID=43655 RepID=A0AAD4ALJ0_9GAMM|nr:hypothetical protein [Pseudoalteromonas citrea]KAF7774669.1 hypothetical protein PCIT_a4539 [Pseudoalteromonas citrea]
MVSKLGNIFSSEILACKIKGYKIITCFVLGYTAQLTGCSVLSGNIDYMLVGSGTVQGNELWVTKMTFDDRWGMPPGSLGCCPLSAGKRSSISDIPFPKKLSVTWTDISQNRIYFGEVAIDSKKGTAFTKNMPPYTYNNGEQNMDPNPYLMVEFGENGEIGVWVASAAYPDYIDRVITQVGAGQAQWRAVPEDN